MASVVGSLAVGAPAAMNAVGPTDTQHTSPDVTLPQGVTEYYDPSTNEIVVVVGAPYSQDSYQVSTQYYMTEVNNGLNTTIYGTDTGDRILLVDNASHSVFADGGDDLIQNLGSGAGVLDGGAGNDFIIGGSGDETLIGGLGDDQIIGGAGHEVINGGAGSDTLTGGGGRDVFVFDNEVTSNDVITDFSASDVLDISARGGQDGVVQQGVDYTIAQVGADTVITLLDHHDTITLKNVSSDHLVQDPKGDGLFTI